MGNPASHLVAGTLRAGHQRRTRSGHDSFLGGSRAFDHRQPVTVLAFSLVVGSALEFSVVVEIALAFSVAVIVERAPFSLVLLLVLFSSFFLVIVGTALAFFCSRFYIGFALFVVLQTELRFSAVTETVSAFSVVVYTELAFSAIVYTELKFSAVAETAVAFFFS